MIDTFLAGKNQFFIQKGIKEFLDRINVATLLQRRLTGTEIGDKMDMIHSLVFSTF